MDDPRLVLAGLFAGAYLLGAVPFGLLIALAVGVDVRAAGSGNIGATNVARTAGKGYGVLTLVLDALKGATPVLVARFALGSETWVQAVAGLAAILGRVFPIFLRFRGGKGVATALGVFSALTPIAIGVAVAVFGVLFAIFRVVSVGSLGGALGLVAGAVFLDARPEVIGLSALVAVLVFVRHAGNIRRLILRQEHKL